MGRKLVDDLRAHHAEGQLAFWFRKSLWNMTYLWRMPTNIRMFRGMRAGAQWRRGHITTVLRPRHDTFCTPDITPMPFKRSPTFVSMPGYHDDCWRSPKPYLAPLSS
jgi:hypothetical protein